MTVTVIIPTIATAKRCASIHRAISSVRQSANPCPKIIVVVNGQVFDDICVQQIATLPGVEIIKVEQASAPNAQLEGRRQVHTPYFCFLDDDDEYLLSTIDMRLDTMHSQPSLDLVVVNGVRGRADGSESIAFPFFSAAQRDPLGELMRSNWLASCGGLFRTSSFPIDFFEDFLPHLKWTWLAFKAASSSRVIAFIDNSGFRAYTTNGSASTSKSYLATIPYLMRRMRQALPLERAALRKQIDAKESNAWHQMAFSN